jgi:ABC-2 type transport system ATP-binding protein
MNAIQLVGLSKKYGTRTAVDNLNLEVYPSDIFGFVGPNGSGKTTTIRMIAGLLRPTHGEASVAGYSVQKSPEEVKRRIGYMPDFFGVYPDLKVWEYLDFFSACYRIEENRRRILIEELLELVELTHRREDMVDRLSRGLKQRLSLARTLIHDPQVLVLDEPAAGLDPRARIEIRALLVELASMGKTVFFSSHILSDVAEICTRVGIIESGSLVAVGGLEELHFQVLPRRRIDLLILDRLEEALSLLRDTQTVSSVDIHTLKNENGRQRISFEFDGDDRMLSKLLSTLVQAQIPVLHFREDERDLEEVFLRATRGIVS